MSSCVRDEFTTVTNVGPLPPSTSVCPCLPNVVLISWMICLWIFVTVPGGGLMVQETLTPVLFFCTVTFGCVTFFLLSLSLFISSSILATLLSRSLSFPFSRSLSRLPLLLPFPCSEGSLTTSEGSLTTSEGSLTTSGIEGICSFGSFPSVIFC